jgi:hypothetical protein
MRAFLGRHNCERHCSGSLQPDVHVKTGVTEAEMSTCTHTLGFVHMLTQFLDSFNKICCLLYKSLFSSKTVTVDKMSIYLHTYLSTYLHTVDLDS